MKWFFLFLMLCAYSHLYAQLGPVKLYVSKTTGQSSKYNGSYSWQTDVLENGSFTLGAEGPIQYTVTPATFSIGPKEYKKWLGTIGPVVSQAPDTGKSVNAALKYDITRSYSRPAIAKGDSETILSTYNCKGCAKHNGVVGQHQIVQVHNKGQLDFVVYTLGVKIEGTDCAYRGSKLTQKAIGFPEGGTYEWKSLTKILVVTGNGPEATVTCKNPTGKGTIEVSYTIDSVTHKQTKEITFFDLRAEIDKRSICDGEGVKVQVKTSPPITPASKVYECIENLQVTNKAVARNDVPVNIIEITEIKFAPFDDKLSSAADVAYWFIPKGKKTECIYDSYYRIWVKADNKLTKKEIKIDSFVLDVEARFNKCIGGDANIWLDTPKLTPPQYKNIDFGAEGDAGTVKFDQPKGNYPALSIEWKKIGKVNNRKNGKDLYAMVAQYTTGNFKLARTEASIKTNEKSQFYPLVKFEEEYHVAQFGGKTAITELKNLLSAQQVINEVNAILKKDAVTFVWTGKNPWNQRTKTEEFERAANNCWNLFMLRVNDEVGQFNNVTAGWAQNIRCRLEAEAKKALREQYKKTGIFIADMNCTYPNCPYDAK